MSSPTRYDTWEKQRLISRIRQLEIDLKEAVKANKPTAAPNAADSTAAAATPTDSGRATPTGAPPNKKRKKGAAPIDPSRYHTRFIALKLAYLGKNYGGFEYQPTTNLPSIESELWSALVRSCLVYPTKDDNGATVDFSGCEYAKCGRTDRGVSAFGQVISLRVRSSRPMEGLAPRKAKTEADVTGDVKMTDAGQAVPEKAPQPQPPKPDPKTWDPIKDELQYVKMLNKLLPPDIRVLAWCPAPPPDFSARFSCTERQYRYFFTQPAFAPLRQSPDSTSPPQGWLDIEAMRTAAQSFVGGHDFRNFCRVDGSKQLTNFRREMFEVDIVEVDDVASTFPYITGPEFDWPTATKKADGTTQAAPKVYSFNVRGSAFLWHQIRHMISVLFMVGQGYEKPSIVKELLDVEKNPRRPNYTMADEVPLVLWDCIFPEGEDKSRALNWVYESDDTKFAPGGLADTLWATWRHHKMDEMLANRLLDLVTNTKTKDGSTGPGNPANASGSRMYFGGSTVKQGGRYFPIMTRQLTPSPDEINTHWAQRKGFKDSDDMRAAGAFWRKKAVDAPAEEEEK
jgi:tRNA pseudouridine38/39 synthase